MMIRRKARGNDKMGEVPACDQLRVVKQRESVDFS